MFSFQSKYIKHFYLKAVKQTIDCHHYTITREDKVVFNVYSFTEMTIVELPDFTLRINRERRLFRKRDHHIYYHTTNEYFGTFDFPDWQRPGKDNCIIRFVDNSVYFFQEDNSHRRLFKPKTWREYHFEMHNYDGDFITYSGSQSEGIIQASSPSKLVPIACGIFAIDESIRTFNESAG